MHHGKISREIARGLRVLRGRIDKAKIPSSMLDESITIATWNIREFGKKARSKAAIHYIAEIIGQFDVVAITEVRDNPRDLERVLRVLGPYWSVVFSDYSADAGGNRERMAYVFDKRAVVFTGLASEANPPRKKVGGEYLPKISWWRSPFMASFRSGNFDFILISAHIRWGSGTAARVGPLQELANWIHKRRREKHVFDKDIILLGDFNIPSRRSSTFEAITSKGLRAPKALLAGDFGTNLARDKRYDQILHYPTDLEYFTDRGGVVDFYSPNHRSLIPDITKREFTYQLSDHLPLWIQVNVWNEDNHLDQILQRY